jgi:putative MFS transporter
MTMADPSPAHADARPIESAPMNAFLWRVTAFTVGGMAVDGYILGHVGVALGLAQSELGLSAVWLGLLAASTLVGILIAAPLVGRLADRVGRRRLLALDFALIVVASLAHLLVTDEVQLVLLRLVMGLAIGAEYAIGAALLAEVVPARRRGVLLALLNAGWIVGFVAAFLVAFWLRGAGASWQVIFATAAAPAAVVFLLRIGTPESPRWLVANGRADEARAIVTARFGPEYGLDGLEPESTGRGGGLRNLLGRTYRTRALFAGLFWACQVVPLFALTIFLPQVLDALRISDEFGAEMLVNGLLLVGSVAGVVAVALLSRRGLTIWSFAIVAAALLVMALADVLPGVVALLAFGVFVLVASAASNLEYVYPGEIFPTDLRATGVGFATAVSRVGAAISTFLLPLSLDGLGSRATMLVLCAVAVVGLVVSVLWAPETKDLTLERSASSDRKGQP